MSAVCLVYILAMIAIAIGGGPFMIGKPREPLTAGAWLITAVLNAGVALSAIYLYSQ